MSSPAAAIWDVDGTLVDTAELHFASWVQLAREIGKPFSRADFRATFGRRNPEIIRALFEPGADDAKIAALGDRKEVMYRSAAMAHGITLLPGVRSLLDGLRSAGWRQAIGSSAPLANLDLILNLTQTRDYFHAIVSMEDTKRGKPDPEVFLISAARLAIPPARCVVLEDAVAGVEAAKAGGMACVAVTSAGHHSPAALQAAGADRVVSSLADLSAHDLARLLGDQ
jgi:beta-phosphoglucomutase